MERLDVKFFGPLRDISLDIKEVNILIGPSSTGKSLLAKLFLLLKDYEQVKKFTTFQSAKHIFERYGMGDMLTTQTYIKYESDNHTLIVNKGAVRRIKKKSSLLKAYNSLIKNSDILSEIDSDDLEEYLNRTLFNSIKVLVTPMYRNIDQLPYKLYFELKTIVHLSGEILARAKYYAYTDLDEFVDSIHSYSHLEESDDELLAELYDDIERLIQYTISFSQKTVPQLKSVQNTLYIPAERILFSLISEKYFTLESSNASLPKALIDFGVIVENARKGNHIYKIDFMRLAYQFKDNKNTISHDESRFTLANAASGIQALVPLFMAIDFTNRVSSSNNNHFIVEEPELNLYPSQQKGLSEYLIKSCAHGNNGITITTHSPYVLTSINNLIQAHNAYVAFPAKELDIEDIVARECWLPYEKVSAYYINEGYAQNIMDSEMKAIGAVHIDEISEELGEEFNKLTDIIYG
ncbi:AAA family ATPase [Hymenobacter artigasi]|uniref:ATPase n=1 Tax=Hymenobacter artigasi TaxID=2719616 RepID=A0ABX1HLL2_9BACT|nr:AAA family ATPase [Hymenobacter artigasi]NKI90032.1 putative ATPase [Hymenobacter artigasi]